MKSVLFAAALLAVASPAMADVLFEDSAMNLADYRTTIYASPDVATQVLSVAGAGFTGNGLGTIYTGTYAQFQNVDSPRFQFMNDSFVYDPSTEGVIDTIQASMDQSLFMSVGGTPVNLASTSLTLRVLAEQDGVLYEAAVLTGGAYTPQYFITAKNGLLASDFKVFNPATPWAPRSLTGLDFSGSAITFGFELTHYALLPGAGGDDRAAYSLLRMDNFNITLRTLEPVDPVDPGVPAGVPEPATWAMMILGFGATGVAVRRRRMAAA